MNCSLSRTWVAIAPPKYPVSKIAPSTAVCGITYRTVQTISTIPSGRAWLSGQPRSANPFTTASGFINFMTPLKSSISTGTALMIYPAQSIFFETVVVSLWDGMSWSL